jgi:quinol monooxygenase YgiN
MDELTRRVDEDFAEQIAAKPGFVSYEFLDCGEGEVMTISAFRDAEEAEASRDLAQRWSEENLADFGFERTEALHGEILVSRAAQQMLEAGHADAARRFASIRRYRLRRGSVEELMHIVDEVFAEQIQELDGFVAYHAIDCEGGEILSISIFRDQATAEESDESALQFVGERLTDFDIERTEVIGGEVVVSRAMAEVLEPAHA